MLTKNKRIVGIVLTVVFLLSVPFVAMQFTSEVNWTLSDFVIAGGLLLGTGLLCEFVVRRVKKTEYRIALCGAILMALVLVWLELSVGIFGTSLSGS